MDLVEVELARVVIQQKCEEQYIHLRERGGERQFPIVIGYHEVEEIQRKLKGLQAVRPMTHDLLGSVISELGYSLDHVVVNDLRNNTYFAQLVLVPEDLTVGEHRIDCRPSDAIALAVQTGARIFVAREIFEALAGS